MLCMQLEGCLSLCNGHVSGMTGMVRLLDSRMHDCALVG